ncbi:MAG: hypothetical protein GX952_04975 [Firmicutes bacterium]|nr:hypothetical protein [Bacillota bacterium]
MLKKRLLAAAFLILLLLASTGTALAIKAFLTTAEIVPGVYIDDVYLGGLNVAEAQAALEQRAQMVDKKEMKLLLADKTVRISRSDIGIEVDLEQTLNAALAIGHTGNLWEQLRQRYQVKKEGHTLGLVFRVDEERLKFFLGRLAEQVDEPARDAYFSLSEGNKLVASPEKTGRALDIEAAADILTAAATSGEGSVTLPVRQITPRTLTQLEKWGVRDIVGIFSTRFDLAAQDRNHNIKLGAEILNGYLIEPGQIFAFNEVVGPREAKRGYREAPVIVGDRLVPDIGGGICQVSSTLYNAALLSGLQPIERRNHSLPVSYIELGRDATLSYGAIDLRFKNTRPEPVMICTRIDGNRLSIAILGTPRGEQVQILTTIEEEIPFPVVYEEDPELPPEADVIQEEGKPGYKVTVTRIIRKNGEIALYEVLSRDTYQPQPEIHLVGPLEQEPELEREQD